MRKYFGAGIAHEKFEWWLGVINAMLPLHVYGLALDSGNKYVLESSKSEVDRGTVWYFVSYVVQMFARA